VKVNDRGEDRDKDSLKGTPRVGCSGTLTALGWCR